MIYFAIAIIVLLVAVLLLRLRFLVVLSQERRTLAVQIGRSGPEIDLAKRRGLIKLFGYSVKRFDLQRGAKKEPKKAAKPLAPKKEKPSRKRSWRNMAAIFPQVTEALWYYTVGLIRSSRVEVFEAEIEAGLPEPHQTGQLFGYYQAAVAALPSALNRVAFTPDWSGASFFGSARVAVAVPLYMLVFRTVLLAKDLPLRKIYKLAIGQKRGASDG